MGEGHAPPSGRKRQLPPQGIIPARREASISPARALKAVARVLGFSRRGWNAFKDYRSRALRQNAAVSLDYIRADSDAPREKIQVMIREYLGVNDERSMRRELAKGRQFEAVFDIQEGKTSP